MFRSMEHIKGRGAQSGDVSARFDLPAREADGEVLIGALDNIEAGNLQTAYDNLEGLAAAERGAASATSENRATSRARITRSPE